MHMDRIIDLSIMISFHDCIRAFFAVVIVSALFYINPCARPVS